MACVRSSVQLGSHLNTIVNAQRHAVSRESFVTRAPTTGKESAQSFRFVRKAPPLSLWYVCQMHHISCTQAIRERGQCPNRGIR